MDGNCGIFVFLQKYHISIVNVVFPFILTFFVLGVYYKLMSTARRCSLSIKQSRLVTAITSYFIVADWLSIKSPS